MFGENESGAPRAVEPQEQPAAENSAPPEASQPDEDTPDDKPKRKPGFIRKLEAKDQEISHLREEISRLKPKDEPQTPGKPKAEDFATYEEYFESLADWKAEQKIQIKLDEREKKAKEESLRREWSSKRETFMRKQEEFARTAPDYDEAVLESGLNEIPNLGAVLMDAEMGPQVAYYLAKHPEEADKLRSLDHTAMIRHVGRLEAKLENVAKPEVRTSKAPPPISPVGQPAKGEFNAYGSKGDDYEAYRRWREQNAT